MALIKMSVIIASVFPRMITIQGQNVGSPPILERELDLHDVYVLFEIP